MSKAGQWSKACAASVTSNRGRLDFLVNLSPSGRSGKTTSHHRCLGSLGFDAICCNWAMSDGAWEASRSDARRPSCVSRGNAAAVQSDCSVGARCSNLDCAEGKLEPAPVFNDLLTQFCCYLHSKSRYLSLKIGFQEINVSTAEN